MRVSPTEIRRVDDRELHVTWADGHRSVFANRWLRQSCPCAMCVDELSGRRILDPASVSPEVRAEEISLVGRYAIRIRWSDRHATGLYTFEKLREWCACAVCRPDGVA